VSSRPGLYSEELGPAFVRSIAGLSAAVVWMLALNIAHPSFAKGFDVPLIALAAMAAFVNPRMALVAGLLTGIVFDSYSDRLFVFHSLYYCLPGALVTLLGGGFLARSNLFALILVMALVIAKFVVQYLWLLVLGHGEWPVVLFHLNWWGLVALGAITFMFWGSYGAWLTGRQKDVRFRRGVYGR
jgi:cell shape-determining protein MreD